VQATTTTKDGPFVTTAQRNFQYPLTIDFAYVVNTDNTSDQKTTVHEGWTRDESTRLDGFPISWSSTANNVDATDTLSFDASGNFLGPTGSKTTGTYTWRNLWGGCYSRTVTAAAQALTAVTDGQGCGGHFHF